MSERNWTEVKEAVERLEHWVKAEAKCNGEAGNSRHGADLSTVLSALKGIMPRKIEECDHYLGEPAMLINDRWGHPVFSWRQSSDGKWWDGDWEHELQATHFIPLSALPLPDDGGEA